MQISGPENFTTRLTQLYESVKGADPQTCLHELQKFGRTMGADQVHQFVDSFESITGGDKNILKSVLLGQNREPVGGMFAKELISSELTQSLHSEMLQAHLGNATRLLSALNPNLGANALNSMFGSMVDQLGGAMQQFASVLNQGMDILQNPNVPQGFKHLAATAMNVAAQGLMQVMDGMYGQFGQIQNQMSGNPLDRLVSGLGNALGAMFPANIQDMIQGGRGQQPLNDIFSNLFSTPQAQQQLGAWLDQAAQQAGGWGNFQPGQLPSPELGPNQPSNNWYHQVGQQLGNVLVDQLKGALPGNVDWSNPEKAIGEITHKAVDTLLFDKDNGFGLPRNYTKNWGLSDKQVRGWGDADATGLIDNFGIGYGKLGKTLWEGKFGGFEVGKLDERAAGAWGEAYIQGQTTFLEASARAFGDVDPKNWSAMIGVEGRAILAGVDYTAGYNTPRLNIGGHDVGINTQANLHAMVGAEGRLMAEVSLKDDPHIKIGGEAFAGARARLDGAASLNIDGRDVAGVRGGVEGWAGVGVKGDLDVGFKDGKFSFDLAFGAALGLGFEVDFGFDIDFGAVGKVLGDIGSDIVTGLEDFGKGVVDVAEDVGEAIGDAAKSVGDAIGDAAEAVGDAIGDAAEAVGDAVSDFFSGW
ncbi:MAG: hypothetical protein JXQ27_02415 [Acidobacteria bacterium]|nr:hypothetical protein [Acidobacteriota bacterium]